MQGRKWCCGLSRGVPIGTDERRDVLIHHKLSLTGEDQMAVETDINIVWQKKHAAHRCVIGTTSYGGQVEEHCPIQRCRQTTKDLRNQHGYLAHKISSGARGRY